MNCSKCGYAIPLGQSHCVYCGTTAPKVEQTVVKKTSAFSRQLNASKSDAKTESAAPAGQPEVQRSVQQPSNAAFTQRPASSFSTQKPSASPFASGSMGAAPSQSPAGTPSFMKPAVAPYARRPMYSAFDPNSENSPFVRKPLDTQAESEPDTKLAQVEIQKTEEQPSAQQPSDKVTEDTAAAVAVSEEPDKKKHNLSIAALTLVFVALVICWFINF